MFIRKVAQTQGGRKYYSYRLVTSYKNAAGKVRQAMLLNLGTDFSISEDKWKILADRVEQLISGQDQLFEFDLPKNIEAMAQRLAKKIIKKRQQFEEEGIKRRDVNPPEVKSDYQMVDIYSTKDDDVRCIGGEYLSNHAIEQLELPKILEKLGFNGKQINLAIAAIVGRLIKPGSELSTYNYLTKDSALDELLGTDFSDLQLNQFYFTPDRLLKHKETIETELYKQEQELFQFSEVITLYDITNTYFEGHPAHSGASRGRSKEKRSDCELISLGLLLDGSGFPKKSKILPGNISEPGTLKEMLLGISSTATVIMDAGIATKDNIEWLKENNYSYIVVRRDSNLVMPENEAIVVKDTMHNKVSVSLVKESDIEVSLYCHSTAKEEQTKVFTNKMIKRLEEELLKLNTGLKFCDLQISANYIKENTTAIILNNGDVYTNITTNDIDNPSLINMLIKYNAAKLDLPEFYKHEQLSNIMHDSNDVLKLLSKWNGQKRTKAKVLNQLRKIFDEFIEKTKPNVTREYSKVLQKIGRLKEHYKGIAYLYDITVIPDIDKHNASVIKYEKKLDKLENKQSGVYCLTSNRTDLPADLLWNTYTMLTDLESAFRSLKSELGMRPVYHQLEHRVDGHIFVSILAYHVLHTIRYQLKLANINYSWNTIRRILSTQARVTTSQNLKDGGTVKTRKTSRATPEQAEIYNALSIPTNPCKLLVTYFKDEKKFV